MFVYDGFNCSFCQYWWSLVVCRSYIIKFRLGVLGFFCLIVKKSIFDFYLLVFKCSFLVVGDKDEEWLGFWNILLMREEVLCLKRVDFYEWKIMYFLKK